MKIRKRYGEKEDFSAPMIISGGRGATSDNLQLVKELLQHSRRKGSRQNGPVVLSGGR